MAVVKKEKRRYRKVLCRMYADEKFMELSRPQPNGQTLWTYLLTGPQTSAVPGLFVAGQAQLAEALRWPLAAFRRCWREIEDREMAFADWEHLVIWLPNAVEHNEPESPNVVNAWRKAIEEIPACNLKTEAMRAIAEYLAERGKEWLEAWQINVDVDPLDERLRRTMRKSPGLRAQIKSRDHDLCRYCGHGVSWTDRRGPTSATYDHVDPSGPTSFSNLVTACRSCNSRKRHRTPCQAGMPLLDPGTDLTQYLGPRDGATSVPSSNQEQEQDQEQEQFRKLSVIR